MLDSVGVDHGELRALDGVSLEIREGDCVGFVGPSGSGKTTLLRLLNGSQRPTRGAVRVAGEQLGALSDSGLRGLRAQIGFVHQDLALVPNLRVAQNVMSGGLGRLGFGAALRDMLLPPREKLREVHALLEQLGIEEKLFERTDRLSGGEQQRVAIARALFQRPVALLADEPVSSVDPARARETVALLVRVCAERGLTLCVSLHNLSLAQSHLSRLVGLRRGRVVFDGPSREIAAEQFEQLYEIEGAAGGRDEYG
ncbi:MAG: ATP-binding cassette domain-containing protein [Deltaproteobacteria bacterium]|nr:ATP-binding cassette domain-containing protein [Deltaproteobacteria bacterium]MBW2419275.1 ATP-binding cassette domain-containing protein [Deltaproteobacteria bacterium]